MLFFLEKIIGNFLVSKESPHRPILLDFGLTKKVSTTIKQALAKMFLASAEVCAGFGAISVIWIEIKLSCAIRVIMVIVVDNNFI